MQQSLVRNLVPVEKKERAEIQYFRPLLRTWRLGVPASINVILNIKSWIPES